jgi:hypothetical protein
VFRRLPLPAPRKLPWALKPLDSARTSLGYDARGRMVMHIDHDVLRGLTPAMVAWWFGHIAGDLVVGGERLNKYLAWHPFDHIYWELVAPGPDGGASAGAKFRIVEAFGRNPHFYIDVIDTVTRLDATGFTAVSFKAGLHVSTLNHDFAAVAGGTQYVSTLTIGIAVPGLCTVINPLIHRMLFPEVMGRAWLRHNIEEVGLLEHLIPVIYPAGPMHQDGGLR